MQPLIFDKSQQGQTRPSTLVTCTG